MIHALGVWPLEPRVPGGGEPVGDELVELLDRHSPTRKRRQVHKALDAGGLQALEITGQRRLERLLLLPLRMPGCDRFRAVHAEDELRIDRLLGPKRAVVVEHGDALGGRHVAVAALLRDLGDELQDARLGRPVIPGGQRVFDGLQSGCGQRRRQHQ